jgi:cation-transporting ATPase I
VSIPGLRILGLPLALAGRAAQLATGVTGGQAHPVNDLRQDVTGVVGAVGHALESSTGRLRTLAAESVELVEDAFGDHRRVWEEHGRAEIELRAVDGPRAAELRRRLKSSLEQLHGVQWAEVNAITNRVAVAFDPKATPLDAVVSVVEAAERAYGVHRRRGGPEEEPPRWDSPDRADHPADVEPIHRTVAALVGDSVGLGFSVMIRLARLPALPIELGGLVSLVDNQPGLRHQLESRLGRRATDLVLPLAQAAANGAAQGPAGILLDMAYRLSVLAELQARRAVWERREAHFYAAPAHKSVEPPELEPRPRPLPDGPIEVWTGRIVGGSLAGFAASLALTRDPRRAADAFLAGIPKAARLGREGFATQFGRVLAGWGVVPLDASALRRLDRVDTVVLDARTLLNGRWEVDRVVAVSDADRDELAARAHTLLDPLDPLTTCEGDGWTLQPLDGGLDGGDGGGGHRDAGETGLVVPAGARGPAEELRRSGATPLALAQGGEVRGLVGVVPELDPAAEVLVAAVRRAGHRLVVAGRAGGVHRRIGADTRIPAGRRMGAAIRSLQADGAVVAAVARRRNTGLAAADVGINLQRRSGRPSWGADLLCGPDLVEAAFIVDATVVAARVSRRSAQLAVAGAALGAGAALLGPAPRAGHRGLTAVNGAGAIALAAGAWSGAALGRRPRPRVRRTTPWHALTAEQVLDRLDSELGGLSSWEAERRRASDAPAPVPGLFDAVLVELANPLTPVLAAGAGLSAVAGSVIDAGLVGGLVGVTSLIGGVQRLGADRALRALARADTSRARARRDGTEVVVSKHDLVPGDVVLLRAGEAVPADCRLLEVSSLEVDESVITGESLPVAKGVEPCPGRELAERTNMVYQDTTVAAGEAVAVVVAVGHDTEVGAGLVAAASATVTGGVEARLERLSRAILPGSAAAAAGVVGVGLLRRWPRAELVGSAVSMAVAAVPEGLPFLATAAQLAAARRLGRRGALVRNPRTIEALGRVDVLCFDKTGTLTEGRIDLRWVSDGRHERPAGDLDEPTRDVLAAALRATPPAGAVVDMTDRAILAGAAEEGIHPVRGVEAWEVVTDLPFEASRSLNAVLGRCTGGNRLSVKGAPEIVLPACDSWWRDGRSVPFDQAAVAEVTRHVAQLAGRGHRVLAVAERVASSRQELDVERIARLELRGLLALGDPVRSTAADAVARIRAAGVETIMITGDHPNTAEAVASELGMVNGRRVVTGADLDGLDDAELDRLVPTVAVFARVTPSHKVRIVKALQRAGRVVAMTGDGANDAAAIRLAHVGVALGERGTPAARDAADLVVIDDRIETIIDAIAEGRALWGSVREALAILVGGNLGEVGFTLVTSLVSRRAPINARQLLLVNLFTDLAPAIAIATRPPADRSLPTLLAEGPDASLGSALNRDIAIRAAATGGGAVAAWWAARLTGSAARASTVGLIALVGTQMGQTILAGRGRSPLVVAIGAGSAAAMVAIVQTPVLSQFFGCRPVGPLGWAQGVSAAALATAASVAASRLLPPAGGRPLLALPPGPVPADGRPGGGSSRDTATLALAP